MRRLAGALAAAVLLAACGPPAASYPTVYVCEPTLNERAPGARPDLEALLPRAIDGRTPDLVDSGWNCTEDKLGTYWGHGVKQLWFAGATWDAGGGDATVVAVFRRPPSDPALPASWVEEFYETGARASSKTENIEITEPAVAEAGPVWRLDTLNDLSFQTVVVWPGEDLVHVVIVATRLAPGGTTRGEHEAGVLAAVQAAVAAKPG